MDRLFNSEGAPELLQSVQTALALAGGDRAVEGELHNDLFGGPGNDNEFDLDLMERDGLGMQGTPQVPAMPAVYHRAFEFRRLNVNEDSDLTVVEGVWREVSSDQTLLANHPESAGVRNKVVFGDNSGDPLSTVSPMRGQAPDVDTGNLASIGYYTDLDTFTTAMRVGDAINTHTMKVNNVGETSLMYARENRLLTGLALDCSRKTMAIVDKLGASQTGLAGSNLQEVTEKVIGIETRQHRLIAEVGNLTNKVNQMHTMMDSVNRNVSSMLSQLKTLSMLDPSSQGLTQTTRPIFRSNTASSAGPPPPPTRAFGDELASLRNELKKIEEAYTDGTCPLETRDLLVSKIQTRIARVEGQLSSNQSMGMSQGAAPTQSSLPFMMPRKTTLGDRASGGFN